MRFVARRPKAIYSEYHEVAMSPTITVYETDVENPPRLVLPDGTELVASKDEIGFRP